MKAQLILENGMRFSGTVFGAEKNIVGEVVFTTGMTGYQETLTDPSFAGQIVTMTFPLTVTTELILRIWRQSTLILKHL